MKEEFNKIPLHVQDFQKLKLLLEELVQDEIMFIKGVSKYALNISSKEHKVTINLRSEFYPDPYLAITAINITPSNQGKGSIVLEWFKTFAKEKGFERLVLQEVITEEAYHFVLKNGFSKKVGPFEEIFRKPDSNDGNYELHL
ncbi:MULTISPECIES: N-acetyltransferase [Bacillus cereus group]|uniref:N-acetyltransferase n=1 Tax=Bacillus cereus group TaxID=86661 RepID=UPI000BEF6ABD|nr:MULTISPECIES: N-acetyltransferase [Bacillus cereus group]PEM44327.1 N-acetyltransferase [Bacillus toyonensis]PFV95827.1 N-acetyltransferase [Bacillus thuringiensis]